MKQESETKHGQRIEAREYLVRDVAEPDLGIGQHYPASEASDLERRGIGLEFSRAADEIRDRVDLQDHIGETIATVCIDFDSDQPYFIHWHIQDREADSLIRRIVERIL